MVMFALVGISTVWMHVAVRRMERRRHPKLREEIFLSDVPDKPFEHDGAATPREATPQRTSVVRLNPPAE
jgi:NNP family nitrate/nitrite transporter-like MFS transporter